MEKTIHNVCPKCRQSTMNVYYEDDSDMKLGAWCESCDLKGFFVGKELFEVAELRATIPTRAPTREEMNSFKIVFSSMGPVSMGVPS